MIRTRFVTGEYIEADDLSSICENVEASIDDIARAISTSDSSSLLLANQPPTVTDTGTLWRITTPAQWVAVNGAMAKLSAVTSDIAYGDAQHGLYIVLVRNNISGSRTVERANPYRTETASLVVEDYVTASLVVISSASSATPPLTPTIVAPYVGYVRLATVTTTVGPNAYVTAHNTAETWTFPGYGPAPAAHGATHLTSAADPIPEATISTSGLMSATQAANLAASLKAAIASTPITVSISAARELSIALRKDASFRTSLAGLGLAFRTDHARFGTGDQPARAVHFHVESELPYTRYEYEVAVSSADLGTFQVVPYSGTASALRAAEVYWKPSSTSAIMVPCSWQDTSSGSIGVRTITLSTAEFIIAFGSVGFASIPNITGLSSYITGYTGSNIPTSGVIVAVIYAYS